LPDTDDDWEYWGKNDAYFGVLSAGRFSNATIAAHREEFFASGRHQISHRFEILETSLGPIPKNRALDFGCGVGRLTEALASRFDHVTGLDVSPSMLGKARENAAAHGHANITYLLSDDRLDAGGPFDFVHTHMVLQHIPRDRGMAIIAKLLALAAPGGVASLHICIGRTITRRKAAYFWLRRNLPPFRWLKNMLHGHAWRRPAMQMNIYPLPDVLALFAQAGMGTTVTTLEQHGDFLTAHVTGRKPLCP
jgi:SAM-dependent methyltransferase